MRKSLFIIFLGILGVLHGKNKSQEREAQILIQNSWDVQYSNPKQSAYYAQQAINLIKEDGKKNDTKAEAMLALSNAQKFLGEFDQGIYTLYESLEYVTHLRAKSIHFCQDVPFSLKSRNLERRPFLAGSLASYYIYVKVCELTV